MTFTFNDAIREVNLISMNGIDDISGEDAIHVINLLRQEYAPTVEMKPYQFEVFKKYRYGVSKGDIDFGGIWPDEPYRMMQYFKEESYTGTTIWDDSFAKSWLHPETIKVIGENNDTATSSRNKD
ncbi:hypothetical protein [Leuconostoc citreum]|uniref:hypothetical protein n=1 Tax=Leuconostoc citreum TaxID=33964 RepID=UPI0012BA422F|nr:hypothetical protein [Leuconostoc citreum]QGN59926.1 hypothetical protein GJ636_00235 [Leuconostoc citreum]QGN61505.1 hypothetical protein GJ636_09530 [Leuconostoc citreum]